MNGLIKTWDDTYTYIYDTLSEQHAGHTINIEKARRLAEALHERTGIPHRVHSLTHGRTTHYIAKAYELENDDPNV